MRGRKEGTWTLEERKGVPGGMGCCLGESRVWLGKEEAGISQSRARQWLLQAKQTEGSQSLVEEKVPIQSVRMCKAVIPPNP